MTLMVLQFKTLRAIPAILIMCAAVGLAGCGAAESANAITERTIVRLTPPPQSGREATPISREVRIVRAQVPEGAGMGVQEQEEEERVSATPVVFVTPVEEPRITSPYGRRSDPFHGRTRMHRGVDFGGETGTPIYAAASGRALMAGYCDRGTGNCVVLQHRSEWRTQYFHLDEVAIRAGERVQTGQLIGYMGATGRATGPHLHFQVSHRGEDVDPMEVLGPTDVPGTNIAEIRATEPSSN
ncbi:MAG: M23 family metallopeptidase [Myxococcales bacterium]|nr:M23 family metallopeptidase [Myxococcales bacterium]